MLSVVKPKDNKARATGIVLVGAIAFVIGAILTWAILSQLSVSSPPTSPRENDVLPDVSTFTPSQGAVTLGNWYFDHHDWAKATEQYRKALSLGLDNADVRSDLGSALRFNNQPEAAAAEYQIAQQAKPRHRKRLSKLALA